MFTAVVKKMVATLCFVLMSITAYADMPPNSYLCHVKVERGVDGVVFVQAYDLADAIHGASEATATSVNSDRLPVVQVLQCVERPGRLRSTSVQAFADNLPR